jgi:hypothetical protein
MTSPVSIDAASIRLRVNVSAHAKSNLKALARKLGLRTNEALEFAIAKALEESSESATLAQRLERIERQLAAMGEAILD